MIYDFLPGSHILINPEDIQEVVTTVSGNVIKSICDAVGDLYLWDGETIERQQIMDRYCIPAEMETTVRRFYKDQGGNEQLIEYLGFWRTNILDKRYVGGEWI